ncbi:MAG: hypothetical protein DCC65_02370 [Planctomycetota bacterium]|nr:MAG: hypothetical protein DCC65_02370 [Planctomycetota bacterium]
MSSLAEWACVFAKKQEVLAMIGIAQLAVGLLCCKAGEWLAAKLGQQSDIPEVKPTVRYQDDDAGRRIHIALPRGSGDGNYATVILNSSPGVCMKAVREYADDEGDFVQTGAFVNDEFLIYVPFSALIYPRAGEYGLRLVVSRLDSATVTFAHLGLWTYEFSLPAPSRWDKLAHLAPLIDLCMMVVRAGGGAVPEKVRHLKSWLSERFELTTPEIAGLRDVMKKGRSDDASSLAERTWFRFFTLQAGGLLGLLASIAKSDGDLTAAELSIIRESALSIAIPESDWPSVSEQLGLVLDDPWQTLGVHHGASPTEIKAAYRRRMQEFHPDHYGRVPKEFEELATRLTINVQRAYDRLKVRFAAAGM